MGWASTREFFSGSRGDASSKPPIGLKWRSSTFLIVTTVNLAIFTDLFFYALIIPVIPFALNSQAGIPEDQVQRWTSILLACYSLALFIGSPLAGLYADHTSSRRWPLLIGLVALAGSTLLLAFGTSIGLFILGRLLQGFSAAIVWSVGCALLVDTMDTAVGVAMGYVNISMSIALLIAPVIGGAVYGAVGYYAVYYIAFGIVGLDILLRLIMIEKKVAKQWSLQGDRDSNTASEQASMIMNPNSSNGLEAAEKLPAVQPHPTARATTNVVTNPSGLVSGGSHEAFPGQKPSEGKTKNVLLVLLKNRRLLVALYGIFVQASIMMGFDAVLALFVQSTFAWNSTAAGILFLAVFLPGFIAPFVGWLADRYGAKWPSVGGFTSLIPLLTCIRFVSQNTLEQKVLLAVLLALLGTALSFSNTPLMAEISYAIEALEEASPGCFGEKGAFGIGYGLFTMAFALGGVVGPLWAGYMLDSKGWGTMGWSFAIFAASAAVVGVLWLGVSAKKKRHGGDGTSEMEQEADEGRNGNGNGVKSSA